jgi:hypothetical protein
LGEEEVEVKEWDSREKQRRGRTREQTRGLKRTRNSVRNSEGRESRTDFGQITLAGNSPNLSCWTLDGQLKSQNRLALNSVYSLTSQTKNPAVRPERTTSKEVGSFLIFLYRRLSTIHALSLSSCLLPFHVPCFNFSLTAWKVVIAAGTQVNVLLSLSHTPIVLSL